MADAMRAGERPSLTRANVCDEILNAQGQSRRTPDGPESLVRIKRTDRDSGLALKRLACRTPGIVYLHHRGGPVAQLGEVVLPGRRAYLFDQVRPHPTLPTTANAINPLRSFSSIALRLAPAARSTPTAERGGAAAATTALRVFLFFRFISPTPPDSLEAILFATIRTRVSRSTRDSPRDNGTTATGKRFPGRRFEVALETPGRRNRELSGRTRRYSDCVPADLAAYAEARGMGPGETQEGEICWRSGVCAYRGDARRPSKAHSFTRPHVDALWRTAFRMTGDRDAADDLTQEACLKAFRSFSRFKPGSNYRAWIFRILTNLCLDHLRRGKAIPLPSPGCGP